MCVRERKKCFIHDTPDQTTKRVLTTAFIATINIILSPFNKCGRKTVVNKYILMIESKFSHSRTANRDIDEGVRKEQVDSQDMFWKYACDRDDSPLHQMSDQVEKIFLKGIFTISFGTNDF